MERNNRRKFLAAGLGIIGAAASGMIAYPLFKFLVPRKEAGQKTLVEISAADIPEGGAKFFEFDGLSAVLVRKKGGALVALSAVCTHLGCIVQWQKEQERFLCPCHAGLYTADGEVVSGPPPRPLVKIPFTLAEGKIIVG